MKWMFTNFTKESLAYQYFPREALYGRCVCVSCVCNTPWKNSIPCSEILLLIRVMKQLDGNSVAIQ